MLIYICKYDIIMQVIKKFKCICMSVSKGQEERPLWSNVR